MDVDLHNDINPAVAASQRYCSVMPPQPGEGVTNALRAAFDPFDEPMPVEFERLLRQLS